MRRAWRSLAAIAMLLASVSILLSAYLWVKGGAEGRKARETQCEREAVQSKLAEAAYAVRDSLPPRARVTREELERFKAQAPTDCPPG